MLSFQKQQFDLLGKWRIFYGILCLGLATFFLYHALHQVTPPRLPDAPRRPRARARPTAKATRNATAGPLTPATHARPPRRAVVDTVAP